MGWSVVVFTSSHRQVAVYGRIMTLRVLILIAVLAGGIAHTAEDSKDPVPEHTNGLGMRFVPVPGTNVQFSVYETRVKDFRVFVRESGYAQMRETSDSDTRMWSMDNDGIKQRGHSWEDPGFPQTEEHPVVGVSWRDAKDFCDWLTLRERMAGRLPADWEYRLPTDHEWSVAVGLDEDPKRTPEENDERIKGKFPWGAWPEGQPLPWGAGNYAGSEAKNGHWPPNFTVMEGYGDGFPRTAPVGSFTPNRFGIYDLGGNVWEWCEDRYDPRFKNRVLRGAAWPDGGRGGLLSSIRVIAQPGLRFDDRGFRCVAGPAAPRR
jgi:formylglycine-generating enzyme required for sulfatase activity